MKTTSALLSTMFRSTLSKSSVTESAINTLIKFTATNQFSSDSYEFWEWYYTTADVQLSFTAKNQSICLNTDCIMTLIDWEFLKKQTSHTMISYMSSLISVQEWKATVHNYD